MNKKEFDTVGSDRLYKRWDIPCPTGPVSSSDKGGDRTGSSSGLYSSEPCGNHGKFSSITISSGKVDSVLSDYQAGHF